MTTTTTTTATTALTGTIRDIAFECISGDYYWGRYGEFKVIINKSTGYINATHLCGLAKNKNGGRKEFFHWKDTVSSTNMIVAFASSLDMSRDDLIVIPANLPNEIRGTYVHNKLLPHIASWASNDFAVKVGDIVDAHIRREYLETIRVKDNNIDLLRKEVASQTIQMSEQSAQMSKQSIQMLEQSAQISN